MTEDEKEEMVYRLWAGFREILGVTADDRRKYDFIAGARSVLHDADLQDEVAGLRAALKPFADAAARFAPYVGQMEEKEVNASFTLAQLRAARDALLPKNGI